MEDEEIEYLKACLAVGLLVLLRTDIGSPEPGALTKYTSAYQIVTGVGERDDEPVAYFGDMGYYAALWVTTMDEFIIASKHQQPGKT